jgi:hypothetical protein
LRRIWQYSAPHGWRRAPKRLASGEVVSSCISPSCPLDLAHRQHRIGSVGFLFSLWETRGDPGSEGTDQDVTRHPHAQVCDLTYAQCRGSPSCHPGHCHVPGRIIIDNPDRVTTPILRILYPTGPGPLNPRCPTTTRPTGTRKARGIPPTDRTPRSTHLAYTQYWTLLFPRSILHFQSAP